MTEVVVPVTPDDIDRAAERRPIRPANSRRRARRAVVEARAAPAHRFVQGARGIQPHAVRSGTSLRSDHRQRRQPRRCRRLRRVPPRLSRRGDGANDVTVAQAPADRAVRRGRAVVVEGYYDDAQSAADERQHETGALMLHPFDHPATVAGQGTMARELESQVAGIDTLVVATGGGGFTAGQAAWFGDRVRIVSVEPQSSQCLRAALAPVYRSMSRSPASPPTRWAPGGSGGRRGRSCGATSMRRSSSSTTASPPPSGRSGTSCA